MSETPDETPVMREGLHGGLLRSGGYNNGAGGRPPEEFRRKAGEKLEHWLDRACSVLEGLASEATDYEQKIKFVESARKLGESFGKYTGLEKKELEVNQPSIKIEFGNMSVEERMEMLKKLEK